MEIQLLPLTHCMNSLTSKLNKPLLFSSSSRLVPFSSSSTTRNTLKLSAAPLEAGWLKSLSCCPPTDDPTRTNADSTWVIGIDPDLSGAMALLKTDSSGCSAQVFDSPYLPVQVGKRIRKRLDARSIVHLLKSLEAPIGTAAYIEQSIPFPKDGKQGWWSGGFGYGLWIGVLVASGFSVIPVPSLSWKKEFELTGAGSTKCIAFELKCQADCIFSLSVPSCSLSLLLRWDEGNGQWSSFSISEFANETVDELLMITHHT